MVTASDLVRYIDAARGDNPLEMVVRGGQLVNVYSGEIYQADVGIAGGRFVSVGDLTGTRQDDNTIVVDATGMHLVPGFFDPHFHAGGCHLSPTQLAVALLTRGTTSTACDFQEHYVVTGPEGARFALDEALNAGLKVYYLVPIHMFVVEEQGRSGCGMRVGHMLEMLDWPETVAINEPPPGPILSKQGEALQIIEKALGMRRIYTGHAPGLRGPLLQAYIATGPSSDHESQQQPEALEKLRLGLRTMMREGSAAPDMINLVNMAHEMPDASRYMMVCTDEVDPIDLSEQGHMDHKIRLAIDNDVRPIVAIQMATINPAEYYRVDNEIGSITPGKFADLLLVPELESMQAQTVMSNGQIVARDGEFVGQVREVDYPDFLVSRINLPADVTPDDLAIVTDLPDGKAKVRVLGIEDGSLISLAEEHTLEVKRGQVLADPSSDILKMAVFDRHHASGQVGLAFVRGFRFERGAVATTYLHPYYNMLVLGTNDSDMVAAVNELRRIGGGIAIVANSKPLKTWALPIVGIFSTEPLAEVHKSFVEMNEALRGLGCMFKAPVLALSFVALNTIPAYGVTSKGLFDVEEQSFVDVVIRSA